MSEGLFKLSPELEVETCYTDIGGHIGWQSEELTVKKLWAVTTRDKVYRLLRPQELQDKKKIMVDRKEPWMSCREIAGRQTVGCRVRGYFGRIKQSRLGFGGRQGFLYQAM